MEMENKSLFHRLKRRSLALNLYFSCFSSSSSKISSEYYTAKGEKCSDLQNIDAYSYRELEVATNGFSSSNKIGEGGFGSVYKGRSEDGKCIAVKVLSAKSKQGQREFVSEIASLSNINHKNLVKLHGACIHGPIRILVYEFLGNGNLAQLLLDGEKSRGKLKWKTRSEIALGIGEGLAYIHEEIEPHIVHRDIKASNVLLDHNFAPKISDFGLSKLLEGYPRVASELINCCFF
ncbi:Protein kinase superfamily protein [Euphorbia peplus]|nr:Protein kinase superfamily protein [Euphorbia peplus]